MPLSILTNCEDVLVLWGGLKPGGCIVLHDTALHCTALRCAALRCVALHCTALHCIVLYCIVLYCIVLAPKGMFSAVLVINRVSILASLLSNRVYGFCPQVLNSRQ